MGAERPQLPAVWRVSRAGRIVSWIGVSLSAMAILGVTKWVLVSANADKVTAALVAAVSIFVALMSWRAGIHPSVVATEDGLVVHNPLGTTTIAWRDIVEVSAGFGGVTISRLSAPPTAAWAVQKTNLGAWSGARTRADAVAATIQELAAERRAIDATTSPGPRPIARRDAEPYDAVRRPLRFPWRMTRVDAAVIGFLQHSSSPLLTAAAAVVLAVPGIALGGILVADQWDAHLLAERGVVVEASVVAVPGLIEVTWPDIQPRTIFLEAGDDAAEHYTVGQHVDVVSDAQHPTRARLVGYQPNDYGYVAGAAGSLFVSSSYLKWWRWLVVAHRDAPPTPAGRHRSDDSR